MNFLSLLEAKAERRSLQERIANVEEDHARDNARISQLEQELQESKTMAENNKNVQEKLDLLKNQWSPMSNILAADSSSPTGSPPARQSVHQISLEQTKVKSSGNDVDTRAKSREDPPLFERAASPSFQQAYEDSLPPPYDNSFV